MSLSPKRQGRLTASAFATAIGIGYDSRQKLFRQLTGREPKFEGNEATQWGQLHEADAISQYEEETGYLVSCAGDEQGFIIHPDHDWLGATPDGFTHAAVIEAKCPASQRIYNRVPDHYMPQIQGQMAITDMEIAHFLVWTPEDFEVYQVPFDSLYWEKCLVYLRDFWESWQADTEPKKRKKPVLPAVDYDKLI